MPIIYYIILLGHLIGTIILSFAPDHAYPLNYYYNLASVLFYVIPLIHCILQYRKDPKYRYSYLLWILTFSTLTIGQLIWSYYNFFTQVGAPYPSLGDVFWLAYYPLQFLILGNIRKKLHHEQTSLDTITLIFLYIIFSLSTSSFLFANLNLEQPLLTTILSFTYPTADALLAAYAVSLLFKQDSHRPLYLSLLVISYLLISIADAIFAYTTNRNLYWNGNYVDFLYTFAHFLMALAVYYLPRVNENTTSAQPEKGIDLSAISPSNKGTA